jgi:hypothetical protein
MPVTATREGTSVPARRPLVIVAAGSAALMAVIVYVNALRNPFVVDDFRLIVENDAMRTLWDVDTLLVRDVTRPVVSLSYLLDTVVWGPIPFGYHLTSLLLHVVNVVLVFSVAFVVSKDRDRQSGQRLAAGTSPTINALAAASLFAVHPMLTQAVAYIAARSEVAYAALFLLAFLAGRRWLLGSGRRWWWSCVGLWLMALLAKETAIMLPFVLLAYDWLLLDANRDERRHRLRRLLLPMAGVTLVAGAVRLAVFRFVEYADGGGFDWRLALGAVDAYWQYLGMFLRPGGQSIFHAAPAVDSLLSPRAMIGCVGLAVFVALAWKLRRIHSVMALGLFWFLLLLVPSSLLFALGRGEAMAEHRAYLSAAGLFLVFGSAFGLAWARFLRLRPLLAVTAVLFLIILGLNTMGRNYIWGDPVLLARETKDLAPGHWVPHILLAEALRHEGRCQEAAVEYRAAIAMRPADEFAYSKLALCLVVDRRRDEARAVLAQLRSVNHVSNDAPSGLGVIAVLDGNLSEARAHFEEIVAREPSDAQARTMLAFISGTLSPAEQHSICLALQALANGPVPVRACTADAQ